MVFSSDKFKGLGRKMLSFSASVFFVTLKQKFLKQKHVATKNPNKKWNFGIRVDK